MLHDGKTATDINYFPLVLHAEHVSDILGVSKRTAYELMERSDFPLVKVGRCKRTPRDAFFRWLNEQSV